ncbi:CRISPR-associated endonuclease Cas1 [Geoalkalibacter halelectricus]|uniref:CRISPR-associated endonuclease Cas1 n=1 Tax=Geoalkalibacter halelectricus TaxID=2847045 RepID=UPI003D25FC6C
MAQLKAESPAHFHRNTHKLEQLVLMGNVIITPPALKLLLRENIDTVFLRVDGRYLGRLASAEPKNVFLRRRQFALAEDSTFCLPVARSIVLGKMANMATVLNRISRTRKQGAAAAAAETIRKLARRSDGASDLEQLRGFEGAASATYFQSLGLGLNQNLGFTKRVRRPPTDPVNAVLSLLYTFLINRAYAAVRVAGLDPYPGVLHSLEYGRHSLPLDLVEEFRTLVADTLTLSLFNLGVLKEEDFYRLAAPQSIAPTSGVVADATIELACQDALGMMSVSAEEDVFDLPDQRLDEVEETPERAGKIAVRLHPAAFIRVIKAFEKKINTEFFHPQAEKKLTYGEALIFQARHYRQVIEGVAAHYQPLLLK